MQLARERADLLDPAHLERLGLEALGQQARRRQRVVDLVRDARDEPADRRELLGLRELFAGAPGLLVEPRVAHRDGGLIADGAQEGGVDRPHRGELVEGDDQCAEQLVADAQRDEDEVARVDPGLDLGRDHRRGVQVTEDERLAAMLLERRDQIGVRLEAEADGDERVRWRRLVRHELRHPVARHDDADALSVHERERARGDATQDLTQVERLGQLARNRREGGHRFHRLGRRVNHVADSGAERQGMGRMVRAMRDAWVAKIPAAAQGRDQVSCVLFRRKVGLVPGFVQPAGWRAMTSSSIQEHACDHSR